MRDYIRWVYSFTPYQRLWLYNGAPLVAFYDTLGYGGRILDFNPRRPHGDTMQDFGYITAPL